MELQLPYYFFLFLCNNVGFPFFVSPFFVCLLDYNHGSMSNGVDAEKRGYGGGGGGECLSVRPARRLSQDRLSTIGVLTRW